MMESLLSVGIDIGTTTTQLVFSRLTLENQGNPFSVPHVVIRDREILYRSRIYFTPLKSDVRIDGPGVREIVAREYERAGVRREQVDTGAVIITGETARKENAREVLRELSDFAGEFVVSTAGPDLESILAARGAGAEQASAEREGVLLHFDIGGGTSNLAAYRQGRLISTGCLDIGGRVVKYQNGRLTWIAPKIQKLLPDLQEGQTATEERLLPVVDLLVHGLEAAAGLRPVEEADRLLTTHKLPSWEGQLRYVSFSGGVADMIWHPKEDWTAFGDLGVLLGRGIARSKLMKQAAPVRLPETIRATVIGAGTQTTELSGSTVFYRGISFPLQNLPVLRLEQEEVTARLLEERSRWLGDDRGRVPFALSIPGLRSPGFEQVQRLAGELAQGYERLEGLVPVIVLEQDMAKALGQALAVKHRGPLLCLDGIRARNGDYLDVGQPVAGGAVLPVIVKTLAFPGNP